MIQRERERQRWEWKSFDGAQVVSRKRESEVEEEEGTLENSDEDFLS